MSKFLFLYTEPTGSGQVIGQTPHGIYDTDSEFQTDSLNTCKYVAQKLGHPVMQLEFNSGSIYACFEEAVSEYSQQINHYNTKNWMWEHYGNTATTTGMSSTGSHAPETAVGGLSLSVGFGNILNLLLINSNEYADFLTKSFVSIAFALAKSYDIVLMI